MGPEVPDLVVAAAVAGALLLGGGLATLVATRRAGPSVRPPRALRRASARDAALVEGIRLAVERSRGVRPADLDAMHTFLTTRVKRRDLRYAARILRLALEGAPAGAAAESPSRLRALDPDHRRLALSLVAWVARADGPLHDADLGFLRRIGAEAGLDADEIEGILSDREG